MKVNLEKTRGLIFSEGLMLKLVQKGLTREAAYSLIQKAAFRSLQGKKDLPSVLLQDRQVLRHMNPKEIRSCFDLGHSLRHVDFIFRRIFGKGGK
jgi:adenylosuccinate lyase